MQLAVQYAACLAGVALLSHLVSWTGACAQAHWYWLHAAGNAVVCALCVPAVHGMVQDPAHAIFVPLLPPFAMPVDAVWIAMLHLFHLLAYQRVSLEDKLHHLLFVPYAQLAVLAPALWDWTYNWGPVLQLQHLFICGVPGMLDYLCLALRKEGRISKARQKRLQVKFNVWLRVPGVLASCTLLLYGLLQWPAAPRSAWILVLLNVLLIGGNSLYYAERVIRASPPVHR